MAEIKRWWAHVLDDRSGLWYSGAKRSKCALVVLASDHDAAMAEKDRDLNRERYVVEAQAEEIKRLKAQLDGLFCDVKEWDKDLHWADDPDFYKMCARKWKIECSSKVAEIKRLKARLSKYEQTSPWTGSTIQWVGAREMSASDIVDEIANRLRR